jgi:hypothetical protein
MSQTKIFFIMQSKYFPEQRQNKWKRSAEYKNSVKVRE